MKTAARVILVLGLVVAGLALMKTWAVDRGNSTGYSGKDSASQNNRDTLRNTEDNSSDSRGSGRFEGKSDDTAEVMDEYDDPDEIEPDPDGIYHFAYEWKWNGEQAINCDIPMIDIIKSEKELREVERSKDPFAMLGINWKKYSDDERNVLFWQNLYRYLYNKNKTRITNLVRVFRDLKRSEKLSDSKLFETILSFVQSLKYKRPGGPLDVLTQPEALYRKFGDCDTKSLLLITLLNNLGYDTVIYYSGYYSHAMAGVYLNGSGEYKKIDGKNIISLKRPIPDGNPAPSPRNSAIPVTGTSAASSKRPRGFDFIPVRYYNI